MNGRTLSRGHRTGRRPRTTALAIRMATRGRERREPAGAQAAGRIDERRRRQGGRPACGDDRGIVDRRLGDGGYSRTGCAGSSIVPQTSRRGASLSAGRARAAAIAVAPPRQRWRLVAGAGPPMRPGSAGRELSDAWETALEATGLPLHRAGRAGRARGSRSGRRCRLGIAAERELADVFLAERVPVWRVREALDGRAAAGLAAGRPVRRLGRRAAAGRPGRRCRLPDRARRRDRRRRRLAGAAHGRARGARAAARCAQKGGGVRGLRPPAAALGRGGRPAAGRRSVLRVRTRIHPELGTGRPEEVVAALGDGLGHDRSTIAQRIVRERLILSADEPA